MIFNTRSKQIAQRDFTIGSHQSGISGRYPIPRNGLVAEYFLNGNALDTSGSGNNGTATNVTYTGTDRGYQSQAGVFNGSSAGIDLGTKTSTSNISFSFWFYPTNVSKTNQCLIGYWSGSTGIYVSYNHITANQITFVNEPSTLKLNCGALSNNTWYHIVATRDSSGNGKVYINNILVQTGTLNTNTGTNPKTIGNQQMVVNYSQGNIQNVKEYNTVLSTQEINSLYMEGLKLLH